MDDNLHNLEQRLGYRFKNLDLLKEALTHKSFVAEYDSSVRDNQRLEYLGDAVVQIVVTAKVFQAFPDCEEGELTRIRATVTRADTLADFARQLHVGDFLRLGIGEDRSEGRVRTSNLCDAFEAVIGAMYVDGDYDTQHAEKLLDSLIGDMHPDAEKVLAGDNPKGQLQEWAQRTHHEKPIYETIDETGPDHEKTFTVTVSIAGDLYAQGSANRLRAAEQEAAREALKKIAT